MTDTAEFSVFCPGMLEVLSIGKGDLRIVVGGSDEDRDQARRLIEEMLQKGYSIFVETDKGPTRVKKFNPQRMTYIIVEPEPTPPAEAGTSKSRRTRQREIPVAGSKATAVGKTAGG